MIPKIEQISHLPTYPYTIPDLAKIVYEWMPIMIYDKDENVYYRVTIEDIQMALKYKQELKK